MGLPRAKLKATYPDNWEQIRLEVFERDGWRCRRCPASLRGNNSRQCHHIIPLSNGGSNKKWNLISLCGSCHDKQHQHMGGH